VHGYDIRYANLEAASTQKNANTYTGNVFVTRYLDLCFDLLTPK